MTIEQIKEMVNGSAYDFLRTNEQSILLEVMRISSSGAWRMLLREIGCHRQEERNISSTL